MAIDLYSRKILGFDLALTENSTTAHQLLERVIADNPGIHTVHSDNGSAMTSYKLRDLFNDHGIALSLIRPRVSDDNAFMESVFHTLKYRQFYPRVFNDIDHAQHWVGEFVEFYNTTHPHSGIKGYTPQSVFDGSWTVMHQRRVDAVTECHRRSPGRFAGMPKVETVPEVVYLNAVDADVHGRRRSLLRV